MANSRTLGVVASLGSLAILVAIGFVLDGYGVRRPAHYWGVCLAVLAGWAIYALVRVVVLRVLGAARSSH